MMMMMCAVVSPVSATETADPCMLVAMYHFVLPFTSVVMVSETSASSCLATVIERQISCHGCISVCFSN